MTRTVKIVLSMAGLAGLIVGVVAAIAAARMLGETTAMVQSIAAQVAPSDFALWQFQYADTDHAREAAQFEIHMLQQLARAEPNDRTLYGQLGLGYTRLGMIEEKAGRAKEARAAFDQARAFVWKAHPDKTMTDEQLRDAVRTMDAASAKARF